MMDGFPLQPVTARPGQPTALVLLAGSRLPEAWATCSACLGP